MIIYPDLWNLYKTYKTLKRFSKFLLAFDVFFWKYFGGSLALWWVFCWFLVVNMITFFFFNGIGQMWFKNWFYKELSLILPSDTELVQGYLMESCMFFPKPTCIKSVYVCFYFLCIDGSLRKRLDMVPTRLWTFGFQMIPGIFGTFCLSDFRIVGSTSLRRAVALVGKQPLLPLMIIHEDPTLSRASQGQR